MKSIRMAQLLVSGMIALSFNSQAFAAKIASPTSAAQKIRPKVGLNGRYINVQPNGRYINRMPTSTTAAAVSR